MKIQELASELDVPWTKVKSAVRALGFDRGWTVQYSPDECQSVRDHLMEERERSAEREAEGSRLAKEKEGRASARDEQRRRRAEERAQIEARRLHRAQREVMAVFSAQVPVSVVPRIRTLSITLSTPERRVTQGEVIAMALDALERERG